MNPKDYILEKINTYFRKISLEAHMNCLDNIGCEYIPTPIEFLIKTLDIIKDREPDFSGKTFLDVGCGVGNMCGVASHMGLQAEGIELNPVLYDIAKQIYPEARFHNIDIRDFNEYQNYDIIFYYCPFISQELQRKLKIKVEDQARVGTYIIVVSWKFEGIKDNRFVKIYSDEIKNLYVWQKIR